MQYKALFLDIDDTLVGSSKEISPGNLAAIRRAQEAGVHVTIATGRGYKGASAIWKALSIQGPIIVYGGAMIMDTRTERMLYCAQIEPALLQEALLAAKEWGLFAQIYQKDEVIAEADSAFFQQYVGFLKLPHSIDPQLLEKQWHNVPKALVYAPGEQEFEMVRRFKERFDGRLEIASSKPGYIEINQYGANKGTTMLELGRLLGIRQEEMIAVGDNTLDMDMIKMAGLGICVANGQQVVKDISDVIAPSCDEDGVKWVIETYLL